MSEITLMLVAEKTHFNGTGLPLRLVLSHSGVADKIMNSGFQILRSKSWLHHVLPVLY